MDRPPHGGNPCAPGRIWSLLLLLVVSPLVLSLLACGGAGPSDWAFGEDTRVLLVLRDGDAAAERIGRRYVAARHLAETHILRISCPDAEEIQRPIYAALIEDPIAGWWRQCPEDRRPNYLLLIKGIPHKIAGSGGSDGDRTSVDSELTRIPRVAAGENPRLNGPERNRYFRSRDASGRYAAFDWRKFGTCLVSRLDGYTEADAIALIDRSAAAARSTAAQKSATSTPSTNDGLFLIDLRGNGNDSGEQWLRMAADAVATRGGRVVVDQDSRFVTEGSDLLGYASWGSNDPAFQRPSGFAWRPGAIACTFVSSSARTFREPPADWTPGPAAASEHRFEGSSQSLIADLIRSGVTGASGNAYEPYLSGCVRPDILFGAALEGRTLGECFYLALPGISWQSVILGDPLSILPGTSQ